MRMFAPYSGSRAEFAALFLLFAFLFLAACAPSCRIYQYDNGDDYFEEGLRRVLDSKGRIGYQDEAGNIAIKPRFAFGFPFRDGKAKVTDSGFKQNLSDGHREWISDNWYYIDASGKRVK